MIYVIYAPKNLGGVRKFSESLYTGLISIGEDCILVVGLFSLFKLTFFKKKYNYFLIASLEAGFFLPFYKKNIFILHGFPTYTGYRFIKYFIYSFVFRIFSNLTRNVVSVSYFTKSMNRIFHNIKTDFVVYNPIQDFYLKYNFEPSYKNKTIIYVGRIHESKGVRNIIKGFTTFSHYNPGYNLKIIGDGPDYNFCVQLANNNLNIKFLGMISDPFLLSKEYSEAEIFISLNDSEPFGIVFLEALRFQLKIIAPIIGGHIEFIPNSYSFYQIFDVNSYEEIALKLYLASVEDIPKSVDLSSFSSEFIAKKYRDIAIIQD
jgi:glycosyltransferase involved in cell wall biosynthesis